MKSPYTPDLSDIPHTFLDCDKRDDGCGIKTYCKAWGEAGYSGTHPTCETIRMRTVERNIYGVPYFSCPRGFQ